MDVEAAFIDDDLGSPERNVAFKEPTKPFVESCVFS
jgi:hypothetical protein